MEGFDMFLVNGSDPAAMSLIEKLIDGPNVPGKIVPLTKEEWELYSGGGVQRVTSVSPEKSDDCMTLLEIDPGKKYIAVVDSRYVKLEDLVIHPNIKVVRVMR